MSHQSKSATALYLKKLKKGEKRYYLMSDAAAQQEVNSHHQLLGLLDNINIMRVIRGPA